jgi:hypothetical protein
VWNAQKAIALAISFMSKKKVFVHFFIKTHLRRAQDVVLWAWAWWRRGGLWENLYKIA